MHRMEMNFFLHDFEPSPLVHILSAPTGLPDDNGPYLQWKLKLIEHPLLRLLGKLLYPAQCSFCFFLNLSHR